MHHEEIVLSCIIFIIEKQFKINHLRKAFYTVSFPLSRYTIYFHTVARAPAITCFKIKTTPFL